MVMRSRHRPATKMRWLVICLRSLVLKDQDMSRLLCRMSGMADLDLVTGREVEELIPPIQPSGVALFEYAVTLASSISKRIHFQAEGFSGGATCLLCEFKLICRLAAVLHNPSSSQARPSHSGLTPYISHQMGAFHRDTWSSAVPGAQCLSA